MTGVQTCALPIERKCFTRVGRGRAEDCGGWCVPGAKDLRFIGRDFHKRGEGLRNDRSANLSPVETGGRKSTNDLRSGFR